VLPCKYCANHYAEKIKANPIRLGSQTELFQWTVDIHNSVNKDNKKKIYTYEQAFQEITKKLEGKDKKPKEYSNYLVSGVALSVSMITMITLFAYSIRKK
jgi:hypothetical protein